MALGMYLEIDGIDGTVNHPGLPRAINIVSWGFRVDSPHGDTPGTGHGLELVLHADSSAPQLFVACLSGRQIERGRILVRAGSGIVLFEVQMEGIIVASMGATADHDDSQPTTEVMLKCRRVAGVYTAHGADGVAGETIVGGWDLVENREWIPEATPDS